MSAERWLPVPELPAYHVSDRGRVRRVLGRSGKPIRPYRPVKLITASNGYLKVNTSHAGVITQHYVHKLVLLAFIGPRPDGHDADHINRRQADNRLANLRWLPAELNRSAYRDELTRRYGPERTDWTAWEAETA